MHASLIVYSTIKEEMSIKANLSYAWADHSLPFVASSASTFLAFLIVWAISSQIAFIFIDWALPIIVGHCDIDGESAVTPYDELFLHLVLCIPDHLLDQKLLSVRIDKTQ